MMRIYQLFILPVLLLLPGASLQAQSPSQSQGQPALEILNPEITSDDLKDLYDHGRYDAVIALVDLQIRVAFDIEDRDEEEWESDEEPPRAKRYFQPEVPLDAVDPTLLYYRGMSYYNSSQYQLALNDLNSAMPRLVELHNQHLASSARRTYSTISKLVKILPKKVVSVDAGRTHLFDIYYDKRTAYVEAIIKSARAAAVDNQKFLGAIVQGTPVFIMRDKAHMQQVTKAARVHFSTEAAGGYASQGGIYLYHSKSLSKKYARAALTHELNHIILEKWLGRARLPRWLDEGMAEFAISIGDKKKLEQNDRIIAYILENDLVINPALLEKYFNQVHEHAYRISKETDEKPSAYAQALSMTRFFLEHIDPDSMDYFLHYGHMIEKPDPKAAFELLTEMDIDLFYNAWLEWARETTEW